MSEENCQNSIKDAISNTMRSDRKFSKKIINRMVWLLVISWLTMIFTICYIIYLQEKRGVLPSITKLASTIIKSFFTLF